MFAVRLTSDRSADVPGEEPPRTHRDPIVVDARVCEVLRGKARDRQFSVRDAMAAAGHDSVFVAPLCPSAMLFIPCAGGITHNPKESTTPEQVARGAQVLLDAVLELAG